MNWSLVIERAQANHGLTQVQLAQLVKCSQANISDLRSGATTEPRFSLGQRLLDLANTQPSAAAMAAPHVTQASATQEV